MDTDDHIYQQACVARMRALAPDIASGLTEAELIAMHEAAMVLTGRSPYDVDSSSITSSTRSVAGSRTGTGFSHEDLAARGRGALSHRYAPPAGGGDDADESVLTDFPEELFEEPEGEAFDERVRESRDTKAFCIRIWRWLDGVKVITPPEGFWDDGLGGRVVWDLRSDTEGEDEDETEDGDGDDDMDEDYVNETEQDDSDDECSNEVTEPDLETYLPSEIDEDEEETEDGDEEMEDGDYVDDPEDTDSDEEMDE